MRPPDLPGGNVDGDVSLVRFCPCFNEAAGFTRRKPGTANASRIRCSGASMRPPDLPGGNTNGATGVTRPGCFNEAAGFTRRKRPSSPSSEVPAAEASMRPPDLPGGNLSERSDATPEDVALQ